MAYTQKKNPKNQSIETGSNYGKEGTDKREP